MKRDLNFAIERILWNRRISTTVFFRMYLPGIEIGHELCETSIAHRLELHHVGVPTIRIPVFFLVLSAFCCSVSTTFAIKCNFTWNLRKSWNRVISIRTRRTTIEWYVFLFTANDGDDSTKISNKQKLTQALIYAHRQMSNEQGQCRLWSGSILLLLHLFSPHSPLQPVRWLQSKQSIASRYIFYDALPNTHTHTHRSVCVGPQHKILETSIFFDFAVGKFWMFQLICVSVDLRTVFTTFTSFRLTESVLFVELLRFYTKSIIW